ncbi:MAG: hypothetical protein AB1491_00230 [Thermodesulfobacteriota bacterium]
MGFVDHNDQCPACGQRKTESEIAGAFCRYCGWLESVITSGPWEDLEKDPDQYGGYLLPQAAQEQDSWADEPVMKPDGYGDEEAAENEAELRYEIARLHDRNNARMMSAVPEFWTLYQLAQQMIEMELRQKGRDGVTLLDYVVAAPLWGRFKQAVQAVAITRIANLETKIPANSLASGEQEI